MLRGIMNKHQADLRKVQTGWFSLGKAAETANKYMSGAMAVTAALMGIIMGLRKAAKAAMDFEERLDNLSALTGLEGRQLQWLGDTAKETSVSITETGVRIKQSATDIIDAYTKVGSQRPELLKNKEALNEVTKAAIILSEAAKSDLEPAVKGLTMAMNQHNLGASEATRIINSFAAGSKLGAANIPYLTAVIEKSGTTLNLMNISLEENIALTEAIAPSFSEAAAAGTSLDRTFLKIQIMFMRKRTAAQMMNVAALKKAIFYEQAFGKALMANPVGLVIAAIGLLVVAIKSYDRYSEQAIAREKEKEEATKSLAYANEFLKETYTGVDKQMSALNKMSIQQKLDLQTKINKTIELAEAELILQQAKQKEIKQHNNQATAWQKTLNYFKSGGVTYLNFAKNFNELNTTDAAKNSEKAAAVMQEGIDNLQDRIVQFKQSGSTLDDIFNAEKIADSIGSDTLTELEEKLSTYQTALKNIKVGTEDYLRVSEKITAVENDIDTARKRNALTSEEQRKKEIAAAKALLKAKIDAATAEHNLITAEIKKQYLQGKISEDEYKGQLLTQELKFIQEKLKIYKVGSVEYAKAYNESLSKQVAAEAKVKDLSLKAEQVLNDARIANFEEGLEKELALQNRKWDQEKLKLQQQLIEKENLSKTEIELNDKIYQTIEEKELEHQAKIATAQSYISTLAGIFGEETAMGKALFLFNQGLAIAEIWVNTAKANAVAVAASPLTFGQPWVTATHYTSRCKHRFSSCSNNRESCKIRLRWFYQR